MLDTLDTKKYSLTITFFVLDQTILNGPLISTFTFYIHSYYMAEKYQCLQWSKFSFHKIIFGGPVTL